VFPLGRPFPPEAVEGVVVEARQFSELLRLVEPVLEALLCDGNRESQ
jgi:hypothetical protein